MFPYNNIVLLKIYSCTFSCGNKLYSKIKLQNYNKLTILEIKNIICKIGCVSFFVNLYPKFIDYNVLNIIVSEQYA